MLLLGQKAPGRAVHLMEFNPWATRPGTWDALCHRHRANYQELIKQDGAWVVRLGAMPLCGHCLRRLRWRTEAVVTMLNEVLALAYGDDVPLTARDLMGVV